MQRKMGVPKNRLKELRLNHDVDITQKQLADLCGVEARSYGRWENWESENTAPIPSACAIKLCQYFGCSLDYLYCLTDENNKPENLATWEL